MKTKNTMFGLMLVAAMAIPFLQSCSKTDDGVISETDLGLAQDETYADALYEDVDNLVSDEMGDLDAAGYNPAALKATQDDICRTITVDHPDSTWFPKVVTIDFGDGCTNVYNGDTITRVGKIIVTVTGRWYVTGSSHTVTFDDYYVNQVKIEGTRTITNLGVNERNNMELGIVLEDGKIIFSDTAFMTREADHVREWIRGSVPMNNTIIITGYAEGTNILGEDYSRLITEPLVMVRCMNYVMRWGIVDGTIEITNSVRGITTIEYNSDGCNRDIAITKNGIRHSYPFRFRFRSGRGNR